MEGEPHKSPKFVDFVEPAPFPEAISKAPVDFLDFRLLGPPKWREPHKSPKFVDFVESAPFPEAISKAPKAGVPRFRPGHSSTNPELVREEPPKARNLATVSRIVPIQKDK